MRRRPFLSALAVSLVVSALAVLEGRAPASAAAPRAECPTDLNCRFVPAAQGRYGPAQRPDDGMDIRYIVIHDTELRHDETVKLFTNPAGATSAHYLVRSADGAVTQFVSNDDVAYHAGNFWFNMHSIGIEHEGFMAEGKDWYTEEMYRASAELVRALADRYDIPLDREHILGHDEIAAIRGARVPEMHNDPGPYWDWEHYFDLLGAPLVDKYASKQPKPAPSVVSLAPLFDMNTRSLQSCTAEGCVDLPAQGSNIVLLRTQPQASAPLLGDKALRPDGSPGTLAIEDLAGKANSGQRFVVAARRNGWVGIWFGGQLGWFYDRAGAIGLPSAGMLVTPLPGRTSIPVYGAAFPEAEAYPSGVTPTAIETLPYSVEMGQFYVGLSEHQADDYTASDAPPKAKVHVVGHRRLIEISFNHRRAFLDAADVLVLR